MNNVRLTWRALDLVHGRNPVMRIGARIPNGRIGRSRGVTELSSEGPAQSTGPPKPISLPSASR